MFHVENNVPDVYVQQSRDFQLFSRLYDLVFQSSRFSVDSMQHISDTMRCNDTLLPLIATKVGFFTDLNLTTHADRLILSAFPYIIPYKGSLQGVILVANLFERIMNTTVAVSVDSFDKSRVWIYFEQYTPNVTLLYSLLEYIRPTGMFINYAVRTDLEKVESDYSFGTQVSHVTFKLNNMIAQDVDTVTDIEEKTNTANTPTIGFTKITKYEPMHTESTTQNSLQEEQDV